LVPQRNHTWDSTPEVEAKAKHYWAMALEVGHYTCTSCALVGGPNDLIEGIKDSSPSPVIPS